MTGYDPEPVRTLPVGTAAGVGPLLVLVAVEFEARGLARRFRPPLAPQNAPRVRVQTIGLGAADLPGLGPRLLGLEPAAVLVTGLCGGCAPDLAPGEIVVGSPVGPTDAGEWLAPPAALAADAVRALEGAALRYRVGRLVTVPRVLSTPEAKARRWHADGALAADMESAHALLWARRAGLPAIAVRAVADSAADALPAALLRAVGPAGRPRPSAVLGWATRPVLFGAAWRLRRRSHAALDALARFLSGFIATRP